MLQINELEIRYGATHAVRAVDISVSGSEVVCLLGPNGAGKTSILRAISGLVPFTGHVMFDDEAVDAVGTVELARRGLIHVPEGRHVFPTLSVHENLRIGEVSASGRSADFTLDDVYTLFPALERMKSRQGYALSGGEQQMVALGRALIAAPRLLLLDEPSLGLSPSVVSIVYGALRVIAGRVPILIVEQNTADALALADRGYVLTEGRVVMEGPSQDLSDRTAILASYLGQSDIETT